MFADTATIAFFYIHIGTLQPYLDFQQASRCNSGDFAGQDADFVPGIGNDFIPFAFQNQVIISGRNLTGPEFCLVKFDIVRILLLYSDLAISYYFKMLIRIYSLGADRTIFLANDAGFTHGPGQASSPVKKCCAKPDHALVLEIAPTMFFIQGDGPNGGSGTNLAAGHTIELATAGTNPEIQLRCPKIFQAMLDLARLDDIGGTDTHALAAFDAALQKTLFCQRSRRPYGLMKKISGSFRGQPDGRHQKQSTASGDEKSPARKAKAGDLATLGFFGLVTHDTLGTYIHAVKTKQALFYIYFLRRFRTAHAIKITSGTGFAQGIFFANAEDTDPGKYSK
jgi:hypothetical protein